MIYSRGRYYNNRKEMQEAEALKEVTKQGKCGSCGKFWNEFDNFDCFLAYAINKGLFQTAEEITAVGIVRAKLGELATK